jgi:general L-amino acid transport system permease protein
LSLIALILLGSYHAMQWGLIHAVFAPDEAACQAVRGDGACWGVLTEKYNLILWGRYPFEQQWRPCLSVVLIIAALLWSSDGSNWKASKRLRLYSVWISCALAFETLMSGGLFGLDLGLGLSHVESELWGGLPLTLLLSLASILLATPLGILLALARTSQMPLLRSLSTTFIEVVRGVPLISVLFMASFLFPLLLPSLKSPDVLLRVLVGITLFSSAYTAEVIRAGLLSVAPGQIEAAKSLGLGYWRTQRHVVLPQALSFVTPGLVNNFISIFKDTSLVTIVSLYELTGAMGLALNGDPIWRPFKLEGYLFIGLIYFCFCFAMSLMSQKLQRSQSHSH